MLNRKIAFLVLSVAVLATASAHAQYHIYWGDMHGHTGQLRWQGQLAGKQGGGGSALPGLRLGGRVHDGWADPHDDRRTGPALHPFWHGRGGSGEAARRSQRGPGPRHRSLRDAGGQPVAGEPAAARRLAGRNRPPGCCSSGVLVPGEEWPGGHWFIVAIGVRLGRGWVVRCCCTTTKRATQPARMVPLWWIERVGRGFGVPMHRPSRHVSGGRGLLENFGNRPLKRFRRTRIRFEW